MSAELLGEIERLHARAEEARRKAARAEAAAEHKRAELVQITEQLKSEYGIESISAASEWLQQAETEARAALDRARELITSEGILE